MKPVKPVLAGLLAVHLASPLVAQTLNEAHALGSTWGYFRYETGAAAVTVLIGQPSLHEGHPSLVLTMMTRDGRPLGEDDRADAARVAAALCAPGGYAFNRASRGSWLNNGGLSFDGDCIR